MDIGSAATNRWPAAGPPPSPWPAGRWSLAGRWRLDSEPSAPATIRRLIKAALADDPWAELRPDAVLVASELTANAWLHGHPPVEARLFVADRAVRIEIADGSSTAPVCPPVGGQGLTGRGIGLVASLSARWGVDDTASGKMVWAELEPDASDEISAPLLGAVVGCETGPPEPERFHVRLGDVPTDLLLAAKNHVDGLVREFALATSGAESGSSGPLPGRLAELLRIVTTRFAEPREAIKRQALAAAAAGDRRTHLDLALAPNSADAGEAYLAALEEIESYARAARLLTLQSPPQHVAFRRWYVHALVDQLRASQAGHTVTTPSFEEYLLDTLDAEVLAGRAAERAARLQRVTAALATATTPEQVAAVVVSEVVTALGASGGVLVVPAEPGDTDAQIRIPGAVGYSEELMARLRAERLDDRLPAVETLRSGRAVWLESRTECYQRYPDLAGLEPSVVAMCCLPLTISDKVLGALRFSFDHSRLFDDDERGFVEALAAQTALALERARLFDAERRARERAAYLTTAGDLFASTLDSGQILDRLLHLLVPRHAAAAAAWRLPTEGIGAAAALDATAVTAGTPEALRRLTGFPPAAVRAAAERGTVISDRTSDLLAFPLSVAGRTAAVIVLGQPGPDRHGDGASLAEELVRRASSSFSNALQYEREREIAVTLQRGLLPRRIPRVPGLTFAWRYLPGSEGALVGGDWYDVLPLDDTRIALMIGDVMGHGPQAAATMGQLRATARACTVDRFQPAEVLAALDATMDRLEQASIATVTMAVLDLARGLVTVASAGHLPPLVIPPGRQAWYPAVDPGPPLSAGLAEYPELVFDLEPGSTLLLFTDGLVEDRSRPIDRGLDLLRRSATAGLAPERLCDGLLATLDRSRGNEDDVAMLAVSLDSAAVTGGLGAALPEATGSGLQYQP